MKKIFLFNTLLLILFNLNAQLDTQKPQIIYQGDDMYMEISYEYSSGNFIVLIKNLSDGVMYFNSRYPGRLPEDKILSYFQGKNGIYYFGSCIINSGVVGLRPHHAETMYFKRILPDTIDVFYIKPLSENDNLKYSSSFKLECIFEYFIMPQIEPYVYSYIEDGKSNIELLNWLKSNNHNICEVILRGQMCF